MNYRSRKVLSIFIIVLASLAILYLIFRNPLLNWGIKKAQSEIKQRLGTSLDIGNAGFSGLLSISMQDVSLLPIYGDTLLMADTLNVRISFWSLWSGTIRIKEFYCSDVNVTVSCRDSSCNFKNFVGQKTKAESVKSERNYALFFKRLLDKAFNLAPQLAVMKNVTLNYMNDTLQRKIIISEFHSDETVIFGTAIDEKNNSLWHCNGTFSQEDHTLNMNVYPEEGMKSRIPFSTELLGLTIGFDTVRISIDGYSWSRNLLKARGKFSVENLNAFHRKISNDTIRVSSASFNVFLNSGKNFVEIDSSTVASLAKIRYRPYLNYTHDKDKKYSIKLSTDKIKSNDFFSSLPEGMFDEVRDLKATGTLQYSLNFIINASEPDNLIFESSLRKEKFRLNGFGSANLLKMNGEFIHSVYEKDRLMRSFRVGYSNPFYTSLDSISPPFINAVLTSEDGNFYFHNGFNEDAFRKSIITNFKAGKFVRGGSTISMQLIKNVFLNRKKTIARKAEEALLVWLIENNNLYSKERMLEVYMNIVELGPNIYGIGEASSFYFSKKPYEINLQEGIFLASLLPHPKWFKYSFDTLGNLKPYLADYYRNVSDFMLKREMISQQEHEQLKPHVILNGPARELIIPSDTIPEDEENDED